MAFAGAIGVEVNEAGLLVVCDEVRRILGLADSEELLLQLALLEDLVEAEETLLLAGLGAFEGVIDLLLGNLDLEPTARPSARESGSFLGTTRSPAIQIIRASSQDALS